MGKVEVKGRIVSCRMEVIGVKAYLPAHAIRMKNKTF
jgi:hypothetical protein